ncbi:MAG: hypothetical protein IKX25_01945 [Bacteroidales bacterium]|nr:hypothetical protein [Bacteroidales bacterium]
MTMITRVLFLTSLWIIGFQFSFAQPSLQKPGTTKNDKGIMAGLDMNNVETSFILNVNSMNEEKKEKLNKVASYYRLHSRSILTDLGTSMLSGGVTAIVNVIGTEIINLTKIRSKQKRTWEEMRLMECTFVDSLQSVSGQSDFYSRQSNYGPLDPTDMNFDGITLRAHKNGQEILRIVCHIDTTRFYHLFLHSKFHLITDTIVFNPYNSFLPNLKANRVQQPRRNNASQNEIDYWETISHFSFEEHQYPSINIKLDIYSSWINELVQVYQDVKLGTFSINIPINEQELNDSIYVYYRERAIAEGKPTIEVAGDCFVVPRSYMPVSANNPSWGTGEYKMKVVLTENCRYNPQSDRSKNWHRDYKQLVKMQNNGKAKNDYLGDVVTTFRDNGNTILKATYSPALYSIPPMIGIKTTGNTAAGMVGTMSGGGTGNKATNGTGGFGYQNNPTGEKQQGK